MSLHGSFSKDDTHKRRDSEIHFHHVYMENPCESPGPFKAQRKGERCAPFPSQNDIICFASNFIAVHRMEGVSNSLRLQHIFQNQRQLKLARGMGKMENERFRILSFMGHSRVILSLLENVHFSRHSNFMVNISFVLSFKTETYLAELFGRVN